MHANVTITVKDGDRIVDYREGHNTWLDFGRDYLARITPDTLFDSHSAYIVFEPTFPSGDVIGEFATISVGLVGTTLLLEVDGGLTQTVTFALPSTPQDIADQINTQTTGLTAALTNTVSPATLSFTSDTVRGSKMELIGGTSLPWFGGGPWWDLFDENILTGARVKYMGFGVGSARQADIPAVSNPPISTSYPPGFDPNATTGNEYDSRYPFQLPITTLERPVRKSGASTAYPGTPGDVWLFGPPALTSYREGASTMIFKATIDVSSLSDIVYPPFIFMPLSEVGLFLETADPGVPFSTEMVAYHSFVTLPLTLGLVEVVWRVVF